MTYISARFGGRVVPPAAPDATIMFRGFVDWPRNREEVPKIVAQMRFARKNEEVIGKIMAEAAAREGHRVSVQKYQTGVPPAAPGETTRARILAALDTPKTTAEIAMALGINKKTVNSAIRGLVWDGTVVPMGFRGRSQVWKCAGDK